MKKILLLHPQILFWGMVCIVIGICWLVRLAFANTGAWNTGIAFSLALPTLTIYMITALVLGGIVGWFSRQSQPTFLKIVGCALIVGGGLTNLIDRIQNSGAVWDYIPFLEFGNFNLADVSVTAGLVILLYSWWKEEKANT